MSEFAIFQTGGKQYRVAQGDIIKVEKLNATGTVEFDQVLMVGDKVGTPFLDGAKIVAEVVEQKRADKILVFKKKRRQNYRRTKGHRQYITVLKITDIKAQGAILWHIRKRVRHQRTDVTRQDAD